MPFQRVPNTAAVHVRGTFQGSDVENSFYYRYAAPLTQTALDALAQAVSDAVVSEWLPLLSSGWTGREVYAVDLDASPSFQSTNSDIAGEVGAVTGDTLPNYATIAVARRSGLTGRSSRGRIFWQGLAESQTLNNNVLPTVINNIINAIELTDAAAEAEGFVPVIVSRYLAGTLRPEAVVFDLVSWVVADLLLDTRRSRRPGIGS